MRRSWPVLATIVLPAFAFACNDVTVEDVPQSVCWSGKRWIGGKRGSEHMYPGRDCVGCHLDNDGPEFIFGGTVYDFVPTSEDQLNQYQSGEDCFGSEGVEVEITTGDGVLFAATTNEAGNFFFEGKQSDVVMPFQVRIIWTARADGREITTPMATRPSYGGCGKCHGFREGDAFNTSPPPDYVVGGTASIGLTGNINFEQEFPELATGSADGVDAFDDEDFGDVELPE